MSANFRNRFVGPVRAASRLAILLMLMCVAAGAGATVQVERARP